VLVLIGLGSSSSSSSSDTSHKNFGAGDAGGTKVVASATVIESDCCSANGSLGSGGDGDDGDRGSDNGASLNLLSDDTLLICFQPVLREAKSHGKN
jgi:hypothetical protein